MDRAGSRRRTRYNSSQLYRVEWNMIQLTSIHNYQQQGHAPCFGVLITFATLTNNNMQCALQPKTGFGCTHNTALSITPAFDSTGSMRGP